MRLHFTILLHSLFQLHLYILVFRITCQKPLLTKSATWRSVWRRNFAIR